MSASSRNSGGGGSATQGGINYQNRVAAWLCGRILAEEEATPLWSLPEDVTLEFVRCETEQPVDDLLVGTSQGGRAFIQVKHTVKSNGKEDTPLGSTLEQFVRQFVSCKEEAHSERDRERPLNESLDRLVLVTSSKSSRAIVEHLPRVLARLRALTSGQGIGDAATNADERKILSVVKNHLEGAWRKVAGAEMTEHDARQVLNLIRVDILDVDEDGRDEREAKDLLRATVVESPAQADAAWSTLVLACAGYASRRSGADRDALRQELTASHIRLKAPRSYRADIERLRQHTQSTLRALRDFSAIRVAEREVKIERASSRALRDAAEQKSLVVVGEPGSGKSGALHGCVEALINENRDVVFLAVDKLEARSLGELRRELNLEHEIMEVLRNWSGDEPRFLVVDALDAARSEASAKTFYDLLANTFQDSTHWRVVASVRKFDLRHNSKLQHLFAGEPPSEYRDGEFRNLCHVNIPLLNAEEWMQIATQAPELGTLFVEAGLTLRALLMVPFNVRLAGELLGGGVSVESLTPVRTQIDLLDLYWRERVIRNDGEDDAREAVLTRAVEAMIRTRSLRANRREIAADPSLSRTLKDVLSSHILSEWESTAHAAADRSVLTFAHHVLFDYAAARLLLRGTPESLVQYLEQEADLVMTIRPSIVMHFQHEWLRDENSFWNATLRVIKSERIPEIGKLIAPTVGVDAARDVDGFDPLLRSLSSADVRTREAAEKAMRHVTGALLVVAMATPERFIGAAAPLWGELLDRFMNEPRATIVYAVQPVLSAMCEHPEKMTERQRHFAGIVARRVLEFALAQQPRDSSLVISGQEAVCRTFESAATASAAALRRCLEPHHVLQFGHEELFRIGNEVERLIPLDSALVGDIYRATFTNDDVSQDETVMMPSRIFGFKSTRKQDFDMARYVLAEKYKQFLEHAPRHATRALIAALNTYATERHTLRPDRGVVEEPFDFDGRTAFIRADLSEIWDDGSTYGDEYPMQMLEVFQSYLERLSVVEGRSEERQELLDLIVAENRAAVLWRRLLESGAKAVATLGHEVRSLAWALPVLLNQDTSRSVGDYLTAIFSRLDDAERERVERAILSVGEVTSEESWVTPEYNRNRLLGCLDRDALVTEEAKAVLAQLEAEKSVPPNEPIFKTGSVRMSAYTDEDYLKDRGVAVEEEQNRRISTLAAPAKVFASKHSNSIPTNAEVEEIIELLKSLHGALRSAEHDGVHESQRHLAWGYLAEACEAIAKSEDFTCESEGGAFTKAVLLETSNYPEPSARPDGDKSFDSHQSWGSPAARVDAAQGLMQLAKRAECADDSVLNAVERLARDEVPAVRFQIAVSLDSLYYTSPDLMWRLLETISREDESRGVLKWLLGSPLRNIAPYKPDRVADLVRVIFERVREGEGSIEVRKRCASIFAGLYLWQKHPASGEVVNRIVDDPARYSEEAHQIVFDVRNWLNLGAVESPDGEKESVRAGSFALLKRFLETTRDGIRAFETKNSTIPFENWSEDDRDKATRLARFAEFVATHLYFVSGAYKRSSGEEEPKVPLGAPERARFLREARPVLELLSEFGYTRLTHYLLQTLEYLVTFDPEGVFLLVGRVVHNGKQGGYQYEPLAVDLIVRLVERFIAEFRHILQGRDECRRVLIEILDTFVEVGWASARRLTYRMEEIFR